MENLTNLRTDAPSKGNGWALLPIGVFLVVYMAVSIIFNDFYLMSVVVAFMIAVLVGCIQHKSTKLDEKLAIMSKGLADKNIVTMILIFLCSGVFAGILGREGAKAVADLMLSFIPAQFSVVVMFIVACFVSMAMGTSCGTITVLAPIGSAVSLATGINPALYIAMIVGGAMFGDNLSFISDTTIAATSTQGCKMRDKFKENFLIALPAAILTIVILLIVAFTNSDVNPYTPDPVNLWLLLPYVLVLIGGIAGINVFVVLITGIVSAIVVKLGLGTPVIDVIGSMGGGASGMFEVIVVTLLVSMLSAIMRHFGGFDALLYGIKRVFKGNRGGQFGVAVLVSAMNVATANNTVAIVMAAPIARTISLEYGISPTRTASLLDIFSCVIQGLIPYGAQIVTAVAMSGISALEMIPFMFYQFFLAISSIIWICIFSRKKSA